MTRVAAVDCGTNSIRLLVADVVDGRLTDVDRRMEVVRLGEGVDRTGRLSDAALERTFAAAQVYADAASGLGATRTRFVATSASRDAENRQVFVDGIRALFGVEPEVVTGSEEAALSFAGATGDLTSLADPLPAPFVVVDIGGGSTEFVLGHHTPLASRSVDVGCVRLTERHLHDDPPTAAQVAAARADVAAAVVAVEESVPLADGRTLVGLAGSVTTVVAHALGLSSYDPDRIHLARLPAADVIRAAGELTAMSRAQRAALPFMHPGRVDVIGAGALVLSVITEHLGLPEVVASEHDILDGIALSLA